LSNPVNRKTQTNRQTDRQTDTDVYITSLAEVTELTVEFLVPKLLQTDSDSLQT